VQPPAEHLNKKNQHEEWACFFCVREDTNSFDEEIQSDYYIDEIGPSVMMPWRYSPHTLNLSIVKKRDPKSVGILYKALEVLSNPNLSCILPTATRNAAVAAATAAAASTASTEVKMEVEEKTVWSISDRVKVLLALCELAKLDDGGELHEVVREKIKVYEKLTTEANRPQFKDSDFARRAKEVAGEEGVALSRLLLDGIEYDRSTDVQVFADRCVMCRGSTLSIDVDPEKVLCCETCDADVHLSCLGLTENPKGEWNCDSCKAKMSNKSAEASSTFHDIDRYRDREVEEQLYNRYTDYLAAKGGATGININVQREERIMNENKCQYCNFSELQLNSPFVIGMNRHEHREYMAKFKHAAVDDEDSGGGQLEMPYFPFVASPNGKSLLESYEQIDKGLKIEPLIVHQICALNMFKARVERIQHTKRRKRRLVAERIIAMTGTNIAPLGTDDEGE